MRLSIHLVVNWCAGQSKPGLGGVLFSLSRDLLAFVSFVDLPLALFVSAEVLGVIACVLNILYGLGGAFSRGHVLLAARRARAHSDVPNHGDESGGKDDSQEDSRVFDEVSHSGNLGHKDSSCCNLRDTGGNLSTTVVNVSVIRAIDVGIL